MVINCPSVDNDVITQVDGPRSTVKGFADSILEYLSCTQYTKVYSSKSLGSHMSARFGNVAWLRGKLKLVMSLVKIQFSEDCCTV